MTDSFPPARGSAVLRIGRASLPGQHYLITFTTHERRRLFSDFAGTAACARALHGAASAGGSRLVAWVLMPDHCHCLLELGAGESLARWVGRVKAAMTRALHGFDSSRSPVWARGFHDRALRREDDLLAMARYVVHNPIRAGLATRLGDYSFWNASWL
jgi:putative transposase